MDYLKRDGWNLAAVYTIDCQFVGDPTKFIAGSLQAMSAMVQLELPHVNVLTKVDLLGEENKVQQDPSMPDGTLPVFHDLSSCAPECRLWLTCTFSLYCVSCMMKHQESSHHMPADDALLMQAALDEYLIPEASGLAQELDKNTSPGFRKLNRAVAQLMDEWSMVAFVALDYSDEESIGDVLAQIDFSIQWGEDADVKIRDLGMGEIGGVDM